MTIDGGDEARVVGFDAVELKRIAGCAALACEGQLALVVEYVAVGARLNLVVATSEGKAV